MHLTPPQQCVKYIDFFKPKFRSYDPWRQTPEHIHISYHSYFLMRTIHAYINPSVNLNSCNCRTTQCFHVYYFTITQRKYTYTRNTLPQITTIDIHSIQCECFTSKYTQILLHQFTCPHVMYFNNNSIYTNSQINNQILSFKS